MTTRLGQKKIKSGDPAYQHLQEELAARGGGGSGGGYVFPIGGIPRSDLTQDVRQALSKAEAAYLASATGIPFSDLSPDVQEALKLGSTSYQVPAGGIPINDLSAEIRKIFTDYTSYYVMSADGIPFVDLSADVKNKITIAAAAYHKPVQGIPVGDLSEEVNTLLNKAGTAYQLPKGGLPLSDLANPVATPADLVPMTEHIADSSLHITDHNKLENIGELSHEEIDRRLHAYLDNIKSISSEIGDARDKFTSLGARINSTIGKNTSILIDTKEEWSKGTLVNLHCNEEGNVSFGYTTAPILWDLYDLKNTSSFTPENKIGQLLMSDKTYINRQGKTWLDGTSWLTHIGFKTKFYVYAPVTGEYDFSILFAGRARMQVAGTLIISDSTTYSGYNAVTRSGKIKLTGGRVYPVVLEMRSFESPDRILGLYWRRPREGQSAEIPMDYISDVGHLKALEGIYESEVIDFKDTDIRSWSLRVSMEDYLEEDDVVSEICVSDDGVMFSDWIETSVDGEIRSRPHRYVKIRLTVRKHYDHYTPLLTSYEIRYVSSSQVEWQQEINEARDTYLRLKDRLEAIEQSIIDVADFRKQFNASMIHPEYFYSVRMATTELNQLKWYYEMAESRADIVPLLDGFVDHFKTTAGIDDEKSNSYNWINEAITQAGNETLFSTDNDWGTFEREKTDYIGEGLQLAFRRLDGSDENVLLRDFYNEYSWNSAQGSLRLGYSSGSGYRYVAQPFYTSHDCGSIQRLQTAVYTYGYDIYKPNIQVSINPTREDGSPNVDINVWASPVVSIPGANLLFEKINAGVMPNTKYWIVLRYLGNNYDYVTMRGTPNNSNTNIRLRSENPEKIPLTTYHSSSSSPTAMGNWSKGSYHLWFKLQEGEEYEPEGTAERIVDYGRDTRFLSATTDHTNNNGVINITYFSSKNKVDWSPGEKDITKIPANRFLKVKVYMARPDTSLGTPRLKKLAIGFVGVSSEVISTPVETASVVTHILLVTDENKDQHIQYFASRDDGQTWVQIKPSQMTDLSIGVPGKKLRIKAVFSGDHPLESLRGWAVQGIRHRDITGHNIVALHEEYVATEGQRLFKLNGRYPVGKNALEVYVNGIYQSMDRDYIELDDGTVQFVDGLYGPDAVGRNADLVTFRVAAGAYDIHDVTQMSRIADLERHHEIDTTTHEVAYEYNGDKVIKETYAGMKHSLIVEYQYDDRGRKELVTKTSADKITTERYLYNAEGLIEKKKVEVILI
ncbi:PA14 domain-containing protein (plasmid) [Paenibacillus sp. EC2-1]|uniref:PA14 domain-containing protein n=1 Tax=Paenibacillus sp. EC2-1 TaxID=3388665 RepID=UPI003BEED571